jgi:hypothetical protein
LANQTALAGTGDRPARRAVFETLADPADRGAAALPDPGGQRGGRRVITAGQEGNGDRDGNDESGGKATRPGNCALP